MRFRLDLCYCGTRYHGWQRQPNAPTVQEELEHALVRLLGPGIEVVGAGRTDTGVHARHYVAHFDVAQPRIPPHELVHPLNAVLPPDISAARCSPVPDEFHARFSATARIYEYVISRRKDPFTREFTYHYARPLDLDLMQEAASILRGCTDFASFCKSGSEPRTTCCKLFRSEWRADADRWTYTVAGDRFLRNMVRALVGTMLDVGRHAIPLQALQSIIEARNRSRAGASVPPQGLSLVGVLYPGEDLNF